MICHDDTCIFPLISLHLNRFNYSCRVMRDMSLSLSTQSHTTLSLNHMAMEASPVVTDTDTAENLEVTDMEANLAREARVEDTITLSHLGLRHLDQSLSRSQK